MYERGLEVIINLDYDRYNELRFEYLVRIGIKLSTSKRAIIMNNDGIQFNPI